MQLFRSIFLGEDVWLAMVEYPDVCPECHVPIIFDEYGVHEAAWDAETLETIQKAGEGGRYVQTVAMASCSNGHSLQGVMSMRPSKGQDAEVRMEYVCVASTLARSHPEVAELLDQLSVVRAAPGVFMPKGSMMTSADGLVRPVILGEDVDIAKSAVLGPLTLVHKSKVGANTRLAHCIVIDSTVDADTSLSGAVVIRTMVTKEGLEEKEEE